MISYGRFKPHSEEGKFFLELLNDSRAHREKPNVWILPRLACPDIVVCGKWGHTLWGTTGGCFLLVHRLFFGAVRG